MVSIWNRDFYLGEPLVEPVQPVQPVQPGGTTSGKLRDRWNQAK